MKTRMTQLRTEKIPYETVYGNYMKNARRKRVAESERTERPTDAEEPDFLNMPNIRTGSFGRDSSFYSGGLNRISFNEHQ